MKKIVISVPHYKCPEDYNPLEHDHRNHPCDWVAGPVAKVLKKKLEAKGFNVVVILGDKARKQEIDLNRPEGRNTDFRAKLDEELKDSDLLIDCHSFPKDSIKYQKWELVVFKSPYDKQQIAQSMFQIMKNLGLNVALQPAFTRDSIINDEVKNGHVAVLIEHNEDLDIEMITDFEVEAIEQFLTGKKSKMSTVLQVVKEKFKDDEEEAWLLEDTTKR